MTRLKTIIAVLFTLATLPARTQTFDQVKQESITNVAAMASAELQADPANREKWVKLHDILKFFYRELSKNERQVYRELLADLVQSTVTSTFTTDEPGIRLKITGRVSNSAGESVKGAQITIYSTDSDGWYTPYDSIQKHMNEADARIMGFLRTDPRGQFDIFTIRPASYPILYDGRVMPAHLNIVIKAPGYPKKQLQVMFDDDPALDAYWRDEATKEGYPVIQLQRTSDSFQSGTLNIILRN
jgi:protocatechuate 3,4-dioxygenase beta subunit